MKIWLNFLIAICFALRDKEYEFNIDNERELLERLLGEEKASELLTYKEMREHMKQERLLAEGSSENNDNQDSDSDNTKYIKIGNEVREVMNKTCKREFMQLFNLFGMKINNAYITKIQDHEYCFSNYACCTMEHFKNMIDNFAININRIRRRFRPMIEVLSFFRGPAIRYFIRQHRNNPKCKNILFDHRKNSLNLYDEEIIKEYSELLVGFISQIRNFVDLKEDIFGNMLCAMCEPGQQRYINFDEEKKTLVFQFSTNVCNNVYRTTNFELKLQYVYKHLVRRIADFIECASDMTLKGYSTARTIIYPKQEFSLNKECYNNFNSDKPECLRFCSDNLDVFKFDQASPFMRHVRQTLKIFYHVFASTGETIEDYYKEVFGYDFHMGLEIQPIIIFSEKSSIALKYNVKDYIIELSEKGGVNPTITNISLGFWAEADYIIQKSDKA